MGADVEQMPTGIDARRPDQCGLGDVVRRDHEGAPGALGVHCHGQDAMHGAQFPGQSQFTREFIVLQRLSWKLGGGGEYAECDRQVEPAAFLGQIGRGEVDSDAAHRELKG
jgi:hypothetical protein